MRNSIKVALLLVLCIPIGVPFLTGGISVVVAHKASSSPNASYNATKNSVVKELGAINKRLNRPDLQTSISELKTKLAEARKVELEYRNAVDTGKSASECQEIAVRWGDFYQPIYDIQSQLGMDLGLTESFLEQKLESLQAVPSRYKKDKASIEKLMQPYKEVSALNSKAVEIISPYAQSLLQVLGGPKRTPAEVDAFLNGELVRILNERKTTGK